MKLTQRDRRAIVFGVATIMLVCGYLYVVSPWVQSWSDARAKVRGVAAERAARELDLARVDALRRQVEPYYGPGLGKPLPPLSEARIAFVKTVEELLKQNGLPSKSTRSQPVQPLREAKGVGLVAVDVECQGPPQSVMQALSKLSQAEQPILVQRMSLTPNAQQQDQLQVSLTLATFARLDPEASP